MQSILNIKVSCFQSYKDSQNPKKVSLLQWLTSSKYRRQVEKIRNLSDKAKRDKLKATLPAITPSGLFSQRKAEALIQHSGFIQFDIDFKENQHISNYEDLKKQISYIKNVAYCGLSVSGTGYWGLVPISYPIQHKGQFEALEEDFLNFGIQLDDKPKSVVSLRGYSWDDTAYFNHAAIPYTRIKKAKPKTIVKPKTRLSTKPLLPKGDTKEQVEYLVQEICNRRIDITTNYDDWFAIGSGIANEFGESGRSYFHQISQFYQGYEPKETDYQYDHCLRTSKFSIGSFFHHCQMAGIEAVQKEQQAALPKRWKIERFILQDGTTVSNVINKYGYPAEWDNPIFQ